jgi:tetratricopeptide (TPR) repeat protein
MRPMSDPVWLMRRTVELERRAKNRAHAHVFALSQLADALDENGDPDEALALSREAVPLIPRIRPRKRRKHAYALADALERITERLRAGGCLEDAVAAQQESIAIREELLAPDDWLEASMVAGSRWELAEDQLALGRNEDAIAAAERSLRDWNEIRDRDANFVLAVGCSLNFLSRGLGAAGRWDVALGAADEAIAIFRANGGGPDLAEALTHRSAALAATGHPAEAQAAAGEAGAIRAAAT